MTTPMTKQDSDLGKTIKQWWSKWLTPIVEKKLYGITVVKPTTRDIDISEARKDLEQTITNLILQARIDELIREWVDIENSNEYVYSRIEELKRGDN